jgi:thiamine biosynthesis protein ThiI
LIGEDKEEIVAVARRIGTFPISILPHEDCCSLFVPRHPETRAKLDGIQRIEGRLEINPMVQEALKQMQTETIEFQGQMEQEAISR